MKRNIYLQQTALEYALNIFQQKLEKAGFYEKFSVEEIETEKALQRATAEPTYSSISSPHFRSSAMDGFAVKSSDTFGASETSPIRLRIGSQALEIDTGRLMPDDKDAVIKIEDVHFTNEKEIEIITALFPWQNVRPVGEDIIQSDMLLPVNHVITPFDIGLLLAGGKTKVTVYKKPRVSILPTGTELIEPGEPLTPGNIIEYNSKVMSALVEQWGGVPKRLSSAADKYEEIKRNVEAEIKRCDILIINAGSSAGKEDYTPEIIDTLGELIVHGVAVKPGKPTALGVISGKPVIGVPGFPVSAALSFELFVKPIIYKMLHQPLPDKERIKCTLSKSVPSSLGSEEFIRVNIGEVGGTYTANPLDRGAGVITSLAKADGILRVPLNSEGVELGEEVEIELLTSRKKIDNALLLVGSHDLSLDIIDNFMRRLFPGSSSVSVNTGSLGGLLALKRGYAHAAGIHLLDPETGVYNVSYVQKYLPGKKVKLLNLVYRDQGLLVNKGNPKNINSLNDLKSSEVKYINRQKGSGTRVLFDFLLNKNNISSEYIKGYEREEFTHLNVGIAVLSGSADAGMGIESAAKALDLDFIPLWSEKYDLCIPEDLLGNEKIKILLKILSNNIFKQELNKMGYDTAQTGKVMDVD